MQEVIARRLGEKRAIVIFDTEFGNTEQVARALASGLQRAGAQVACVNVKDVDVRSVADHELIVIGSPTQRFTASKRIKEFIGKLSDINELKGRFFFAFDTKLPSRISGSGAKFVEGRLERMGLRALSPYSSAIVTKKEGPLLPGEDIRFEQIGFTIGTDFVIAEQAVA